MNSLKHHHTITLALSGLILAATTTRAADTPAQAKATTVKVFGVEMTVPAIFEEKAKKSRMLDYEFKLVGDGETDGPDADGRMTLMAAGGDIQANIKRWEGQFAGGDPTKNTTDKIQVGKFDVYLVRVNGDYKDSMGGGPFFGGKKTLRKDYAMDAAIIVEKGGRKYFVKLTGPQELVDEHHDQFVAMIKSLGQ